MEPLLGKPKQSTDFRRQFDALVAQALTLPDIATPMKWWYLVFKPYDDVYDEYNDWFTTPKFPNWARDQLKSYSKHMIWTVEKDAKKHHVNMLIYTSQDLSIFHDYSYTGYAKVYCRPCLDYRDCVFYIFKEAYTRLFIQYNDYYISCPPQGTLIPERQKPSFVHKCVERARKALFG